MQNPIQPILWITDPWNTLTHSNDTTLRLMQESLKMGIPTYWSSSNFILNTPNSTTFLVAEVKELSLTPEGEPLVRFPIEASKIHQYHYRLDPPVDFNYISLLDSIADRCRKGNAEGRIFSPPELIKTQSEKRPPKELSALTPRGWVIEDLRDASEAYSILKDDPKIVTKPMNQAQSIGVASWETPQSLKAWEVLMMKITTNFTQPQLVQEYLPGINSGEVRMWFANGEFVAALKKYPKSGDFRVLIDEGSKVEAYQLSSSEQERAKQVGEVLKTQRVKLAAIDFIDGKISDYNITSPGLLVQLEKVHGNQNFAKVVLEKLL